MQKRDALRPGVGGEGAQGIFAGNEEGAGYFVQSLARGLHVVRAFGKDATALPLADVARKTGMSRAAARRYLLTLRDLGYVECQGSAFRLKPRLLELGYAYLSSLSLWDVAQPLLESLVGAIRETCSVSVLDVPDIVYVARVPVKRIITPTVSIGTRLPAFVTSMGRVMLAELPSNELDAYLAGVELTPFTELTVTDRERLGTIICEAGRSGFALVDQEFELGLRSLGVPIRDRSRKVIAALNVSTHASRVSPEELRAQYLPHLLKTSAEITANLP